MALEDGVSVKIGADSSELDSAIDDIAKKFQSIGDRLTGIGTGLTAALTVPIAAIAGGAYKAFEALDEGLDMVRVKTGATGEALGSLGASFRAVLAGVPDAAHDVAVAFSEVAAKTGQVGEPLEKLTTNFLNLSRITGESLAPLVQNTTRLFGDWSISMEGQSAAMDKVYRAAQLTGQSFTGLGEKMVQYGAPLRQLGFSFEESAAMIGKFQKEGVNTEIVLGAMRTALGKFGAAGLEPVKAFKDLVAGIKESDIATGNLLAKQATNTKVFSDFAAAVREGRFDFDGLVESMEKGSDTIQQSAKDTADFAEAWGEFRNKMTVALEPMGAALSRVLTDLMPFFEGLIGLVSGLATQFANLSPTTQLIVIAMAALAAAAGPVLIALGSIASAVTALMAPAALAALAVTLKVIAIALAAVAAAWLVVQWWKWLADLAPVKAALGWIADAIQTLISWVMKIPGVSSAVKAMSDGWEGMKKSLSGLADSAKAGVSHVVSLGSGLVKTGDAAAGIVPPVKLATGGIDLFGKEASKATDDTKKLAAGIAAMEKDLVAFRKQQDDLATSWQRAQAAMANYTVDLKAAGAALQAVGGTDFSAIEAAAKSVRDMDSAAKTLGVTWDRDVNGALEKARLAFERMEDGWRKGTVSTREYNLALVGYLNQQLDAAKKLDSTSVEGKKRIEELGKALDEAKGKVGNLVTASDGMSKNFQEFGKQVSTIFTDFGKDVASAIVHWDGLGAAATKCWVAIKEAFVRNIIEGTFKELFSNIKLIDFKFGELGKTVQTLFNNIAKLFGGGTAAAGSAIEGAGAGVGGAGGGVGSAAGGFTGIVSAVSGAITAVTSVLGYLQGRRMEQDIGRIEVTSREIKAELMNFRKDAWDREQHWYVRTADMWQTAVNTLQVLEQIRDVGIQATGRSTDDQMFAMLDARTGQIAEMLDAGFNAMVSTVGTGTMNLWNLINGYTNKLLLSIAQSTSMLYQVMAKPGFTGTGTTLPVFATAGGGGTTVSNTVNLTTQSNDPNYLARLVQNAVTQAMGRL